MAFNCDGIDVDVFSVKTWVELVFLELANIEPESLIEHGKKDGLLLCFPFFVCHQALRTLRYEGYQGEAERLEELWPMHTIS